MKLQQFLNKINKMVEERPNILDLDVITTSDDEGNDFNLVSYEPSVGLLTNNNEFIIEDQFDEWDISKNTKPNAICIN